MHNGHHNGGCLQKQLPWFRAISQLHQTASDITDRHDSSRNNILCIQYVLHVAAVEKHPVPMKWWRRLKLPDSNLSLLLSKLSHMSLCSHTDHMDVSTWLCLHLPISCTDWLTFLLSWYEYLNDLCNICTFLLVQLSEKSKHQSKDHV